MYPGAMTKEILPEAPADDSLATRIFKILVNKTINDISYDDMNRIVRRLARMPKSERGVPLRVADVLADELGPKKALQYCDKALAAGTITVKEYDEMRAALILPIPRKEIPEPTVRKLVAEITEGQTRLREDFRRLTGAGQEIFQKSYKAVDSDVQKLKKSLGIKR